MDSTLAAGWIAFWGAVGGAVVGGAIAATASWLTTSQQWKRDRAERREAALEADLRAMTQAVTNLLPTSPDMPARFTRDANVNQQMNLTHALALRSSPWLAAALSDWYLGEDGRGRKTRPVSDASLLNSVVGAWLLDPKMFEKTKTPMSVVANDLGLSWHGSTG